MSCARSLRRLLSGPAALLALGIVLLGSAPAPAADLTNPAGNVITDRNSGLAATADGDRLTNLGGIEVTGTEVFGMGAVGGMSAPPVVRLNLTNSGFIFATATGGAASSTSSARAYGMAGGEGGILTNHGSIFATAAGGAANDASYANANAYAYGMAGGEGGILTNHGFIFASATGGTATNETAPLATAIATAYGMGGGDAATLANYGSIFVSATGGAASSAASYADACGMVLINDAGGEGAAANYGVIRTRAAVRDPAQERRAHELMVLGGTARVTAWALDLRDFSDTSARPFRVEKFSGNGGFSGTLHFNAATLILRPGETDAGFALNREYAVKDMVTVYGPDADFSGTVARALAEMPLLTARLSGTDVSNQTVSLRAHVTPRTNPGQNAVVQGLDAARGQADIVGTALAWQATPAPQAGKTPSADLVTGGAPGGRWEFFGLPYYSHTSNHEPDYTAGSVGLLLGGTYRFNERFAAGLHAGFSGGRADGELMNLDNTAQSWLAGAHAVCNVTPEWYVRGQFSGFGSEYDQSYRSGLAQFPLYGDGDFNGYGLYAALNAGYAWRINDSNILAPELGLSWLWSHQDAWNLRWTGRGGAALPGYNMRFDAQDYQSVDGTAMLRWRGNFALGSERAGSLRPILGLGVRQRLNDEDVESSLRFAGSSFSTRVSEDRTTALAEAGLEWRMGGFALGLAYTGAYGDSRKTHGGWLNLRCAF